MTLRCGPVTVERLGPTTVRLEARTGVVVCLDPAGNLESSRDCDLVLVTERVDPDAIRRVAREDVLVVVPEGIDSGELDLPLERVRSHETFVIGPLDLHTTPTAESGGERSGTACGYAVTMDGVTAFWPGRTVVLDSHFGMDVDLLLVPVGLEGTMGLREAADLADALDPDLVVPVGSESAVEIESFIADVATRGVPIVLEPPARTDG